MAFTKEQIKEIDAFLRALFQRLKSVAQYDSASKFARKFIRAHMSNSSLPLYRGDPNGKLSDTMDEEGRTYWAWLPHHADSTRGLMGEEARKALDLALRMVPQFALLGNTTLRQRNLTEEMRGLCSDYLELCGYPVNAANTLPSDAEGSAGYLGGAALADVLAVDATRRNAFFRQLERHRKKLGDDCWQEVRDPRANCPRFLYRVDAPKLRNLAKRYTEPKPD